MKRGEAGKHPRWENARKMAFPWGRRLLGGLRTMVLREEGTLRKSYVRFCCYPSCPLAMRKNQPISLPGETEAAQHPPGLAQVFPMNVHCAVAHFPSGHLQPQTSPWPPGLHRPPWGSHCLPPAPAAVVQRGV